MEDGKIKISLKSVNKVREFIRVTEKYKSDIDIMTSRAIVDAKSIIGILALDLSDDIYVKIISDDVSERRNFEADMEEFK